MGLPTARNCQPDTSLGMAFNLPLELDQRGDDIRAVRMHDERDFALEPIIEVN